ncbi:MAG TPA: 2,3-bisphosphoglycerate-independent phosphoglycerate mutase [Candidatus Limnocylindrales bacterium]|nr:2,3-bisphosphoglycerate-independent phosphoglycerate mutase [Candidatus Limnocylindrales bacterium]
MSPYRPVVLVVLDGWGIAPDGPGNAVTRSKTPRLAAIAAGHPHARLDASGRAVGLPDGVMGNSEVGHLTMGAGFIQYQELVRINDGIADGSFFENEALRAAAAKVRDGGTLHLMGLLSTGGVHADLAHLNALVELAHREHVKDVAIHVFLDGRDMPPRSALDLLPQVTGRIASVQGRYWAMDRDKRWDRTARAWRAIVDADAPPAPTAEAALRDTYADPDVGDEMMPPRIVGPGARVNDGDAVVFFNFRPDRARQLTRAFMQPGFSDFAIARRPRDLTFVTMTDYKVDLPEMRVAFAQQDVTPLAQDLSAAGVRQLHVAETEKYAHVTYFFNGGHEPPYPGEERTLVPSPKVATYDLKPEMSDAGVAEAVVHAIEGGAFGFVVVNFANPDMVGHTGDIDAALKAMAATDAAVARVLDATLAAGGAALVTADHGNAEEMLFPDGSRNTQHSMNPVPVILVANDDARLRLRDGGLRDIAPTLLELLGLPVPKRMTGASLLSSSR